MRAFRTWSAVFKAARTYISQAAIGIAIGAMLVIWCFAFPGGVKLAQALGLGNALHPAVVVSTLALAVWIITYRRPSG